RWISTYYMHPIGEVLKTMLPASSTKLTKEIYELSEKGVLERADSTSRSGQLLLAVFGKKKTSVAALTVRKKVKRLKDEMPELYDGVDLRSLVRHGLVAKCKGTTVKARAIPGFEPTVFLGANRDD